MAICALSSVGMASEQHRTEPRLVGPAYYGNTGMKQEIKEELTPIQKIEKKFAPILRTEATLEEIDKTFSGSQVAATDFAREVFDHLSGTNGQPMVVAEAQKKLPENTILSVHTFHKDLSKEGVPMQTKVNISVDSGSVQKHESSTSLVAIKSGFLINFNHTFDYRTGVPVISLVETPISEEEKITVQENITTNKMVACILSNECNIPYSGGSTNGLKRNYDLPL